MLHTVFWLTVLVVDFKIGYAQRKCYVNCVGESRELRRKKYVWVSEKYIIMGVFDLKVSRSRQSAVLSASSLGWRPPGWEAGPVLSHSWKGSEYVTQHGVNHSRPTLSLSLSLSFSLTCNILSFVVDKEESSYFYKLVLLSLHSRYTTYIIKWL